MSPEKGTPGAQREEHRAYSIQSAVPGWQGQRFRCEGSRHENVTVRKEQYDMMLLVSQEVS
jgi:hypothetical protein